MSPAAPRFSALRRWLKFSCRAGNPRQLGFARLIALSCFTFFFWAWGDLLCLWAGISDQHWQPVSYFKFFPEPSLSVSQAVVLVEIWRGLLLCACVGFLSAVTLPASFFLSIFVIGSSYMHGKVSHSTHLPMLVFGVLAFSPCADALSVDAWLRKKFRLAREGKPHSAFRYGRPIRLIQFIVSLTYLAACLQKIRFNGFAWAPAENFAALLLTRYQVSPLSVWLLGHTFLMEMVNPCVLLLQFSFPLALFVPELSLVIVPSLILFHVTVYFLFRLNFLFYIPCLLFWWPTMRSTARKWYGRIPLYAATPKKLPANGAG